MRLRDNLRLNPFPSTDLANALACAEFKLGSFLPDHYVPPVVPTPT